MEPPPITGIAEVTLEARDPRLLEDFYTGVLGLEVIAREADRVWLAAGPDGRIGVWLPGKKEYGDRGGRHVHFALRVGPGGIEALAARLDAMRLAFRGPVRHPGGDRSIYLEDPEGNVVELWDIARPGEDTADDEVAGAAPEPAPA